MRAFGRRRGGCCDGGTCETTLTMMWMERCSRRLMCECELAGPTAKCECEMEMGAHVCVHVGSKLSHLPLKRVGFVTAPTPFQPKRLPTGESHHAPQFQTAAILPHFLRLLVTMMEKGKLVLIFSVITSIITSILIRIIHIRNKVTSVVCFHILWNRPCKIIISNTEICQCRDICNL